MSISYRFQYYFFAPLGQFGENCAPKYPPLRQATSAAMMRRLNGDPKYIPGYWTTEAIAEGVHPDLSHNERTRIISSGFFATPGWSMQVSKQPTQPDRNLSS